KVDARSDIFSFAVVLYEMVTGTRAFAGDSALSTLSAILRDETRAIPEIAPDTPPQLEHVIHRCLRKHPDQRFQTMKEVQTALGALKHESDSGMLYRTRAGMEPFPQASKRSTLPLGMTWLTGAGAAVVVLAVAGGGAWWWTHRAPTIEPAAPVVAETNPQPGTPRVAPAAPVVAQTNPQPATPVVAEQPASAPVPPPAPTDQALTNDNIIQMMEAKVSQAIILL